MIALKLSIHDKRKYTIKSTYFFDQWVFCGNEDQSPGGQNWGNMAEPVVSSMMQTDCVKKGTRCD
jgi:hypothetical protein